MSLTAGTFGHRAVGSLLALVALAGALFHLGRPAVAWKAFRNLRRSWLSREVALLSAYAGLAVLAVVAPAMAPAAAVVGVAGIYASARIYVVPGRPAWNSPLTVVRFLATAVATGPLLTGHEELAVAGVVTAAGAAIASLVRRSRAGDLPAEGSVRLELRWFRKWTGVRFALALLCLPAIAWAPIVAFVLVAASELIGRWLFFVTVVPLNMPGAFWRGAAGSHR